MLVSILQMTLEFWTDDPKDDHHIWNRYKDRRYINDSQLSWEKILTTLYKQP